MRRIFEWWNDAWWIWCLEEGKPVAFIKLINQPPPPVTNKATKPGG